MPGALADPRCYAAPNADPFVALAENDAGDASQREWPQAALVAAYRDALERNAEDAIVRSLRNATSARALQRLWRALDRAVQAGAPAADAAVLRLFALPLLIVTGGKAGATLAGVLPDIARVRHVLEEGGALGPARSFALGNALCALESLQALPFSRLHALHADAAAGAAGRLDLPPADLSTNSADEAVHLRFLVGAGITAAGAPSFLETGSAIGAWGIPLTRELGEQLRVEGLSLLCIPRPPQSLLAAQPTGVIAREDLAFQAFVSRTLRRFRAEVGEPDVALAALASGGIGVRFTSPFVEDRVAVHSRALHATEDLDAAVEAMTTLLGECGIAAVTMLPGVTDDAAFARSRAAPAQ